MEYTLDAVTVSGAEIELVPNARLRFVPAGGTVERTAGSQPVGRGDRVGTLRVTSAALDALAAAGAGTKAQRASLLAQERAVDAPVDGTLRVAGGTASIAAPGVDVVASLSPIQYLRYLSVSFAGTAQVETVLGPTSVPCTALWSVPDAEASNESAARLHCRLPSYVETAPGLRSTVTISSARIKDALLVPNLYLGYDEDSGQYYVEVVRDGATRRVDLEAGPSDGVVRVVRGPLEAGDRLSRPGGAQP